MFLWKSDTSERGVNFVGLYVWNTNLSSEWLCHACWCSKLMPSGICTVLKSKCHRPERKRKPYELIFSLFWKCIFEYGMARKQLSLIPSCTLIVDLDKLLCGLMIGGFWRNYIKLYRIACLHWQLECKYSLRICCVWWVSVFTRRSNSINSSLLKSRYVSTSVWPRNHDLLLTVRTSVTFRTSWTKSLLRF
jgi:hypothetical protein